MLAHRVIAVVKLSQEVKEDPRHGITIRLSGDSVVRKGTTDAGTSPSAASMVSILARHEGYAVAMDKPAGLTTEELIHHFESQETLAFH